MANQSKEELKKQLNFDESALVEISHEVSKIPGVSKKTHIRIMEVFLTAGQLSKDKLLDQAQVGEVLGIPKKAVISKIPSARNKLMKAHRKVLANKPGYGYQIAQVQGAVDAGVKKYRTAAQYSYRGSETINTDYDWGSLEQVDPERYLTYLQLKAIEQTGRKLIRQVDTLSLCEETHQLSIHYENQLPKSAAASRPN